MVVFPDPGSTLELSSHRNQFPSAPQLIGTNWHCPIARLTVVVTRLYLFEFSSFERETCAIQKVYVLASFWVRNPVPTSFWRRDITVQRRQHFDTRILPDFTVVTSLSILEAKNVTNPRNFDIIKIFTFRTQSERQLSPEFGWLLWRYCKSKISIGSSLFQELCTIVHHCWTVLGLFSGFLRYPSRKFLFLVWIWDLLIFRAWTVQVPGILDLLSWGWNFGFVQGIF